MKLYDVGAILLVIAVIYFGEWLYEKSQPELCGYTEQHGEIAVTRWSECDTTEETLK